MVFLMRQRRTDTKAVEAGKEQEKLAQDKFEKHCRDEPRSKYVGNFQAYIWQRWASRWKGAGTGHGQVGRDRACRQAGRRGQVEKAPYGLSEEGRCARM